MGIFHVKTMKNMQTDKEYENILKILFFYSNKVLFFLIKEQIGILGLVVIYTIIHLNDL